jgi:hypothetical protein
VKGILLDNKRASSFMPSGVENTPICAFQFGLSDNEDDEEENDATLSIDLDTSGMKQFRDRKTAQLRQFVTLLVREKIGAIFLLEAVLDNELIKLLANNNIICIQNVDRTEFDLLCSECNIKSVVLNVITAKMDNEISILHLDVPKSLGSTCKSVVKSIKEIAFGPTRTVIHVVPLSSSYSTLLLRGPIDDIVEEYKSLFKRLAVNLLRVRMATPT